MLSKAHLIVITFCFVFFGGGEGGKGGGVLSIKGLQLK